MAPTETPQAQNGLENAAAHAAEQANLSNEQDQTYDPLCCTAPPPTDPDPDKPTG